MHLLYEFRYANVFDTRQLSVIRGSSFLLKDAIEAISTEFSTQLLTVSTGASSGLFITQNDVDAAVLTEAIVNRLNQAGTDFKLLCFIVEYCQADSLLQAKEQLLAQLRIRQMQSPTYTPDFIEAGNPELAYPDTLEGRRIATQNYQPPIHKQTRQLSHSVYRRWQRGRQLKQSYYFQQLKNATVAQQQQLQQLSAYDFSQSFEALAEQASYTKLNAKMAVIYIDGNRFSKIQASILDKAANQIATQQAFDQQIQQYRAEFLLQLLMDMLADSSTGHFQHGLIVETKTIRVETLLWGGDEMLFVLPAWLGFEFLQYFYAHTANWCIHGEDLTHAAGLVFCHAKTPIDKIRDLAIAIAEAVKQTSALNSPNNTAGREQNAWGYMVLESIDYPSNNNIADFNRQHYAELFNKPSLIGAATNWGALRQPLDQLINQGLLPRRQLYRLISALNIPENNSTTLATLCWENMLECHGDETSLTKQEQLEIRLLSVSAAPQALAASLKRIAYELFQLDFAHAPQRLIFWVYLYDLWDYISPQAAQNGESA